MCIPPPLRRARGGGGRCHVHCPPKEVHWGRKVPRASPHRMDGPDAPPGSTPWLLFPLQGSSVALLLQVHIKKE